MPLRTEVPRETAVVGLWLLLGLTGCGSMFHVKPTPPLVTGCLSAPTAFVPDEPEAPPPGAPITDVYVRAMKGWGNALLGVITSDRIGWRGERRCIHDLQQEGKIR